MIVINKYVFYFNDGTRLSEFRHDEYIKGNVYQEFSTKFVVEDKRINTFTGGWEFRLIEAR